MITGGVENLIKWIEDNDITEWTLTTRPETKANFFIFKSNSGVPREREIERMKNILSYTDDQYIYINAKSDGKTNCGNFSQCWANSMYKGSTPYGLGTMPAAPAVDIDAKIETAIMQERMTWQMKELERDRAELKAAKKEFDEEKSSVWGLVVEKAAPIISGFLQKRIPSVNMAGTDGDVPAPELIPAEPVDEADTFTDEEADKLFALAERWKKADQDDFLKLFEVMVQFAEGRQIMGFDYNSIKKMLL